MGPDGGEVEARRVATAVVVAGGVGLVVGRTLFAISVPDRTFYGDVWSVWAAFVFLSLGLSLILLGLAIWHYLRFRVGTLVAIGLLAVGVSLFTLNDFVDGDAVWSRGYSGNRLVGSWLIIASTMLVLIGVLWSAGQHLTEAAATAAWWRRPWVIVVGGVVVLSIIGRVSFIFFGDEAAILAAGIADEGDEGRLQQEEWSITPDGDIAGSYIFSMIKTFSPMEQAAVEDLGGRLVWSETEIDLCDVNIYSAGDEFVQIGIVSPTTEGCPGMLAAFVNFGLPRTACLFVQFDGIDDEYCAPLAAD